MLLALILQSTAGQGTLAATCWCSHATVQRVRHAARTASEGLLWQHGHLLSAQKAGQWNKTALHSS